MRMKKKVLSFALAAVTASMLLTGCGSNQESSKDSSDQAIKVVSREDGSGTRGAFVELFGVEEKNSKGEKVDLTTTEAMITNSTSVMMTTIGENQWGIGYISLGSLDDTVKAVKIDGAEPSVDNVKNGSYKIVRPFNIVTNEKKLSTQAKDFISFIMSKEGQQVVSDNGYITIDDNAKEYKAANAKGKIVVAGSSSVTPVMEKLKEAYVAKNKDANIEVQQSDSTTGVSSAIEGTCDIGMASRELADSESKKSVAATAIAKDGIAVIVNKKNDISDLTSEQVKAVFTGKTTSWGDVSK